MSNYETDPRYKQVIEWMDSLTEDERKQLVADVQRRQRDKYVLINRINRKGAELVKRTYQQLLDEF